jgi:hypothetical protein
MSCSCELLTDDVIQGTVAPIVVVTGRLEVDVVTIIPDDTTVFVHCFFSAEADFQQHWGVSYGGASQGL